MTKTAAATCRTDGNPNAPMAIPSAVSPAIVARPNRHMVASSKPTTAAVRP
jgi:hypothetical protein